MKKLILINMLVLFTDLNICVFGMKNKIKEKPTETSQQSVQKTQAMEKAREAERARLIKAIEQRRREIDRLEEDYIYPIKTGAFYNPYGRSPQLESWRPEKRTAKAKIPVLESEIQALELQLSNL